jgi:hypothetical protein
MAPLGVGHGRPDASAPPSRKAKGDRRDRILLLNLRFRHSSRRERECRTRSASEYSLGHASSRRERECRKRKFSRRMRSPLHWGGQKHPGDHAPPRGGALGCKRDENVNFLRIYGFLGGPGGEVGVVTHIYESSYRRQSNSTTTRPGRVNYYRSLLLLSETAQPSGA